MRYNRTDIISVRYLCAVGMRETHDWFGEDADPQWEVYARLSNGTDFLFGENGTRAEAEECMRKAYDDFLHSGLAFTPTLENAHVNVMNIARLYVDTDGNDHVAFCEDISGVSYRLYRGEEEEATAHIHRLASEVAFILIQRKHEDDDESSSTQGIASA